MEYRFADWKAYHEFMDAHKTELKEGDRITIDKPIMPGAFPVTTFEVVPPLPEYPKRKPAEYEWVVPDHD